MTTLRIQNIKKSYKNKNVVKDISLEISSGEIIGLLGPNGAGKTTSFYMIVGLIQPEHGSILVDNTDITKKPIHVRSQLGLAYLPQEPSIFRKMNVEENIISILELRKLNKDDIKTKLNLLLTEHGMELKSAREEFDKLYLKHHLDNNVSMKDLSIVSGVERTHLYRKLKQLGLKNSK
jgi:lipopolysaccharide export system ATP-binding protein